MGKYLNEEFILSWIRNPNKSYNGESLFWKAVVQSFPVAGDILAWKVGNGRFVSWGRMLFLTIQIKESFGINLLIIFKVGGLQPCIDLLNWGIMLAAGLVVYRGAGVGRYLEGLVEYLCRFAY